MVKKRIYGYKISPTGLQSRPHYDTGNRQRNEDIHQSTRTPSSLGRPLFVAAVGRFSKPQLCDFLKKSSRPIFIRHTLNTAVNCCFSLSGTLLSTEGIPCRISMLRPSRVSKMLRLACFFTKMARAKIKSFGHNRRKFWINSQPACKLPVLQEDLYE